MNLRISDSAKSGRQLVGACSDIFIMHKFQLRNENDWFSDGGFIGQFEMGTVLMTDGTLAEV